MAHTHKQAPRDAGQPLDELSIETLRGVGPQVAAKLEKFGLSTVQDLLFLLPLRYEDRTRIVPIGSLKPGDKAVIEGDIELTEAVYRGRRMLLSQVSDGSGFITLRFFHFSKTQQTGLARGRRIRCFGEVRAGGKGLELIHPEYRFLSAENAAPVEETLTPIYPATEGIQQPRLRNLTNQALELFRRETVTDLIPAEILDQTRMPSLSESILYLHRPPPDASLELLASGHHPAQRRLALEELLAHHLSLRRLRARLRCDPAIAIKPSPKMEDRFFDSLPFSLTDAQQRVIAEINADIALPVPMLRLVQGDVGSGKTVVAAAATVRVVAAGYQAAIMAPTELLAEQHHVNFKGWFDKLHIPVAWLSGATKGRARTQTLSGIASGAAKVIVGTHALFQEGVEFNKLALIVVDEQHRFGVHQRMALMKKGIVATSHPHQLIMTATPIPRTLAMTAYADLDASVIDELPPGRKPVKTVAISDRRRADVVQRVHDACKQGQQAYWVCPLIDESEVLEYQAAEETAAMLREALPDLKIGLVHGRMNGAKKDKVMTAFKKADIDLLVATTVIEVGVDVPNASLMIVENSERMGLAQLHQLRGRVGRGERESHCLLLYRAPLSQIARTRLGVLRKTNDGFAIARKDLELRGPGEVMGTRQTGLIQMRVADLLRDADLLPLVHRAAGVMQESSPAEVDALIRRWIGTAQVYGKVG